MKINKNKKQKKVVRYMVKPQYFQYLGLVVDTSTDIEDETIVDEEGYKAIIQQKIKDLLFITETTVTNKIDGTYTKTFSRIESKLKEGQLLIFYPGKGYTVPRQEFLTVEEIKEDLDCLDFSEEALKGEYILIYNEMEEKIIGN